MGMKKTLAALFCATGLISSAVAAPLAGGDVIAVDLSSGSGSAAKFNVIASKNGSITAGSVVKYADGTTVADGVAVALGNSFDAGGDSGAHGDWAGTAADKYYVEEADDIMYNNPTSPITVTFSGLDDALTYNARIYAIYDDGGGATDTYTVTDGAGTKTSVMTRADRKSKATLEEAGGVFTGLSTDGSGNIVTSVQVTAGSGWTGFAAVVLEVIDPASTPAPAVGKSLQITSTTANPGQVIKDLSSHTAVDELTIEFWAKIPSAAGSKNWVSLAMLNSNMSPVGLALGGAGNFAVYTGSSGNNYININDRFLDQWHHYAITIELAATGTPIPSGSNEAGRKASRVYIDGYNIFTEQAELRTVAGVNDLSSAWGNGSNSFPATVDLASLTFGGWTSAVTYEIDELRIWTKVRTQEEIRTNMNRSDVSGSGLIANYKCDGDNADLVDSSGAGNTATGVVSGNFTRATSYAQVFDASSLSGWNYPDSAGSGKSVTRKDGALKVDNATVSAGAYVVEAAINTSSATVNTSLPSGVVERFEREWYVKEVGTVTVDMTFDTTGIVDTIPAQNKAKLLYRATTGDAFTEVASASAVSGNEFTFSSVPVLSGYYTFGSTTTITPAIGLEASQNGTELVWTVEDEIDVKEYQIINAETKEVIEVVLAVGADFYSITVPEGIEIELDVVDKSGVKQTYKPAAGDVKITVYNLSQGWNLIAVTADDVDLGTLKDETVGVVWGWNGTSYEVVESAEATQGIWVYSPTAKKVTMTGTKSNRSIKLSGGWNMVGPVENDYIPAGAATVYSWNEVYDIIAGDHKILVEGKGYWIFSL